MKIGDKVKIIKGLNAGEIGSICYITVNGIIAIVENSDGSTFAEFTDRLQPYVGTKLTKQDCM